MSPSQPNLFDSCSRALARKDLTVSEKHRKLDLLTKKKLAVQMLFYWYRLCDHCVECSVGNSEHLTNYSQCLCTNVTSCDSERSIIRSARPGDVFSLPCLTMMHLFVKHPIDSHWLHPYGRGCLLWSARCLWNNIASNERWGAKRQSGLNLHLRHMVIANTKLKKSWMKVCNEV